MGEPDTVVHGPWLGRMSEREFLICLMTRLESMPAEVRQIPLYNQEIDIVAPPDWPT